MMPLEHPNTKKKLCAGGLRISSSKQLEGDSLEDQKIIISLLAERIGGEVVTWFRYVQSATGEDMEKQPFRDVIDHCKAHRGEFEYLLVSRIDRFTRGGFPVFQYLQNELAKYNVSLRDAEGIISNSVVDTFEMYGLDTTYKWALNDPDRQKIIQETESNKEEGKKILRRMIGAEIQYTQKGYWMRRPPYGFKSVELVTPNGKRKVLMPEDKEADYIKLMFELASQGNLSDMEIVEELNVRGYVSRTYHTHKDGQIIDTHGGIPLKCSQLRKYLSNPLYVGVICERWTKNKPVKAIFDGLVTIETFNKANKGKKFIAVDDAGTMEIGTGLVAEWRLKKRKNNPDFAYKQYVLCPECHKPLLGSSSTGKLGKKHPAYHCSRNHKRFGVNKKTFDETIEEFSNAVELSDDFREKFLETLREEWAKRQSGFTDKALDINTQIMECDMQIKKKLEDFSNTSSPVMKSLIENQVEEIHKKREVIIGSRNKNEHEELDMDRIIKDAKYYMEHLPELLMGDKDPLINASFFGLLFEERPTYTDLVNGTPKLSSIFKLNEEYKKSKNHMVTPRRVELRLPG